MLGDFVLAEVIEAPENKALAATRRKFGNRFWQKGKPLLGDKLTGGGRLVNDLQIIDGPTAI